MLPLQTDSTEAAREWELPALPMGTGLCTAVDPTQFSLLFLSLSASSPSPGLTTQPFLAWKAQPSLLLKFFPPQHQNYSTGRCLAFVSLHINTEKEGKGSCKY